MKDQPYMPQCDLSKAMTPQEIARHGVVISKNDKQEFIVYAPYKSYALVSGGIHMSKSLTEAGYSELAEYLHSHENDIALEINDFGRLANLFTEVWAREPQPAEV